MNFMFNLNLSAHEALQLGKILIDAAIKNDDGESTALYHQLIGVLTNGAK